MDCAFVLKHCHRLNEVGKVWQLGQGLICVNPIFLLLRYHLQLLHREQNALIVIDKAEG
jgi:hypothetical protein